MGIFQDFIDLTRWTSVDFGPPNTKEDLANDMDLTDPNTASLLTVFGTKWRKILRINSLSRAYF